MCKPVDILLVGVGGQGTILASKVLCAAAEAAGFDIKMSEIHGMAQRGGSVVTQVRLGEKVYSPLIEEGCADIMLSFEKLEALRWLHWMKNDGTIIVNNYAVAPVPVLAGVAEYPANVLEYIEEKVPGCTILHAVEIAKSCGNSKAANVVLLGAMAREMPVSREFWQQALDSVIPPKLLDINKKAFDAGYNAVN
ncbi:MAG: indolepyruvate oxidoreductase subunit beta [Clostridiales bacterium]|nr:indolepyruvate oxidoreductase subunit beta [Clostridiales bacterium]MCF8022524.1 indolepyruvate oxidoreductase subunit beta [Clostridiales bacterium]